MYQLPKLAFTLMVLPLIVVNSACSNTLNKADHPGFSMVGKITDKRIKESSGLAVSRKSSDLYWTLNDSGNKNRVFAINSQGQKIGAFEIEGAKNRDWEDLASFSLEGEDYLLIADVGDNKAQRKKLHLHIVKEPKKKALSVDKTFSIKPKWSIKYTYEDGARDCESVAVDTANKEILLLSKRDDPPVLYRLPLVQKPKKQQAVAQRLQDMPLELISANDIRNMKHLAFNGQPTAMDIASDGKKAVVLTYLALYYFEDNTAKTAAELLTSKPHVVRLPYLEQAESVSFNEDATAILITTEGLPAPLIKLDIANRFKQ